MRSNLFSLVPRAVPLVRTEFRCIATDLPVPESVPVLERLQASEPRSMFCQPPVLWDRAEDFQVYDRFGNMWLDWTSGVLVANAGHAASKVKQAILETVQHGLLHTFAFPNEPRERLTRRLLSKAPAGLNKVYLFTTGSEATECAIKLARTCGQTLRSAKTGIVTFQNAFHGRTLGAQMAGGIPGLKRWIREPAPGFYQVPFPDGFRTPNYTFADFLGFLESQGLAPDQVAGIMLETYQGGGASFAPVDFVRSLRDWCTVNQVQLVFDEVQAGFGRTGRYFAFEHYGVTPDLICCGKGLSGSLPVSAVIGPAAVMDLQNPGEMTSTHAGNPVCCAAALANLEVIDEDNLVDNARRMGGILHAELAKLQRAFKVIGASHGQGLVAGLHITQAGGDEPNPALAAEIVYQCYIRGLLLLAPLGFGNATVKICPPLTITERAVREGAGVLQESLCAALEAGAAAQQLS